MITLDRKYDLDETVGFFKKKLDFLFSKDKFNNKNGAHYIFKKNFFYKKKKIKQSFIIDNCTNIHYKKDLITAKRIYPKMKIKVLNTVDPVYSKTEIKKLKKYCEIKTELYSRKRH